MVDHHLVHTALLVYPAVVAAHRGHQFTALALDRFQAKRDSEGDIVLLQAAHVRHQIHGHDLGREAAVRRHDFEPRAAGRYHFGRLQGRMVTRIVEQQHVAPGLHVAAEDVPGRHHEFIAGAQHLGMRQAAGGDDDNIG